MAIKVVYPETDFVAVPGGSEINLALLDAEVFASAITVLFSKTYREAKPVPAIGFQFSGSGSLSGPDQTLLDGIVAAHTGVVIGAPGIEHGGTLRYFLRAGAPTGNDDETQTLVVKDGYQVSDIWIETGASRAHFLVDATATSANWIRFV